jgi:hypothetical protein
MLKGSNLAGRKLRYLKVIAEFANMGDTVDRWHAFNNRWPWFIPAELFEDSEQEIQRNAERAKPPHSSDVPQRAHTLAVDRVTVHDWVRTADGKWVYYVEPRILLLRNTLRGAWVGGVEAGQQMERLLKLREFPGEASVDSSASVSVDWRRGSLVFVPRSEVEAACYALLQKSTLAKFCANPDCPAPYFVARRATQRYCSPDCLKPFQKQSKLEWWNREGKVRRAKAADKSRKKREK